MSKIINKFLVKITSNKSGQYFIDKKIRKLQKLTGVGRGYDVYNSGEFGIFKKLKNLLNSNCCIFDVGAHNGDFTRLALSCLNENTSFSIHCFEPSKTTFEILAKNLNENQYVILNNIGLGKEKGQFNLYSNFRSDVKASLTKRNPKHLGERFDQCEKVQIDTIDNYCPEKNIQYIDLLKIDVEGHELDVLYGAEDMFVSNNIKAVSFEFGDCNVDTRTFFRDFYWFFEERDFQLYRITPSGYLYPLPPYNELYEQFRVTNFLAIRKDLE